MTKQIEQAGIPVVHACSIVPISKTVGANRILPTIAIPYPFGDPEKTRKEEKKMRKELVKKALRALATPIDNQTVF
jgi:glycine reductase complex component B subunit gamma